jgi:hypothetical protein
VATQKTMASGQVSFDMKLVDRVVFQQEDTFESFVGQFQIHTNKIICVVNGTHLKHYTPDSIPVLQLVFDHKQTKGKITEYHFRNLNGNTRYCFFSREAAKLFYPRLDQVDTIPNTIKTNFVKLQQPKEVVIIDRGKRLVFPCVDCQVIASSS